MYCDVGSLGVGVGRHKEGIMAGQPIARDPVAAGQFSAAPFDWTVESGPNGGLVRVCGTPHQVGDALIYMYVEDFAPYARNMAIGHSFRFWTAPSGVQRGRGQQTRDGVFCR